MLLTAVNSETNLSQTASTAEGIKMEAKSQITLTTESLGSGNSDIPSQQDLQTSREVSVISISEAQRLISLFFALCKKVCVVFGDAPYAQSYFLFKDSPRSDESLFFRNLVSFDLSLKFMGELQKW
jgi:predicted metalloprotease with PDZ domain